ncbi:MAG: HAD family phosphatase [Oscillospiraceae bacterium]|nr:HAD family phosphatase [Oscillospiraceae bacterium]
MIRGVIFDLDGVLLDSMCIWQDLGGQFLRIHGIAPEPGLSELLFSMSMEQGAQYLSRSYPLGMSPEAVAAGIQELLRDFYYNCVQPKPGAQALLEFLSTKRIPMAAATSSPRSHVTHALTRTGLIGFLSPILTTSELSTSKHEPHIYMEAAKALGSTPAETLVLEDSLYALKTAKAAGFCTVGVWDPLGEPNQQALRSEACCYLTSLLEFPARWDELNK